MAVVVGPSNYVEPYGGIPKPAPLHVDANGGLVLGAGAVAALLGSVRIQDATGATLAEVISAGNADALAAGRASLSVVPQLYGFNGATWDRLRTTPAADGQPATGILQVSLTGRNGSGTYDRIGADADADARGIRAALQTGAYGYIYSGLGWDRLRSASAANLGATSGLGAALVSEPGEWSIVSFPAVNTVATATRAGAAGVRKVCRSVSASVISVGVPVPGVLQVFVRDGASGAGAIVYGVRLVLQAVSGDKVIYSSPPLHIVGTAGNAMTVEFDVAPGVNAFEGISASGYDAL